jgi:hypothetical protein
MDSFANLTREEVENFAAEQIDLMIRYRLVPEWRREIEIQAYLERYDAHAREQTRLMDA